jgi:Transcriptional regulators
MHRTRPEAETGEAASLCPGLTSVRSANPETDGVPEGREALLAALDVACRGIAAATLMFHQAVADRLGLNATDHKCAEMLLRDGPLTAGDLAERTGLTTGAITGVIDRLESAGFVQRQRDSADRRKVFVYPDREKMCQEVAPLFESLAADMSALWARYSDAELALVLDFLNRSRAAAREATLRLRQEEASGADRSDGADGQAP